MSATKLIYVAVCLLSGLIKSYSQDHPFINYTPKDGLISSRVLNLYQDSKGRILFMSANGLSVYDGARFHNYGISEGLANPLVNDVLELAPDSFLIATNINALNTWVRGKIKTLQTKNGFVPVINKFYRSWDHKIYVASDQGFYLFENNVFIRINLDDSTGKNVNSYDDIHEIGNYFLLKRVSVLSSSSDLLLVHKHTLKFQSFHVPGHVSSVLPLAEEHVILMIVNQKLVSLDLNAAKEGIVKYKVIPPRLQALSGSKLYIISIDRFKNIWAFRNNKIIKVKPDGTMQVFDKSNGLNVNNIRSVIVDKENVLWVITDGSGVLKLVNRNIELYSSDISEIYEDPSGKTWKLESNSQILFDMNSGVQYKLNHGAAKKFSSLGARKKSLLLFDQWTVYELASPKPYHQNLSIKKIYENSKDGIYHYRTEVDEYDNIYIPGRYLTIIDNRNVVSKIDLPGIIDQVSIDNHQQLWVVTRGADLLCYKINQTTSHVTLNLVFSDKLPIREPRSIVADRTGKIWIGTRYSGLYCLEYKSKKLVSQKHWTITNGLSDNFVYHLACDNNNVVWAGTQSGLDKISFSEEVVESITRNNNIYRVIHKVVTGKNNRVWGIGNGSIISLTDEDMVSENYQPQLQISRLTSGGKNLGIVADHTEFSSATRELTIEVAAPSFIDEKQVQYSYQLDGTNPGRWSAPSTEASFRFINLKPADYTLRLKAIFPVRHYAPQELVYHFTILPAWWQTWWFRTFLIFLFLVGIRFLIKTYYQKKLQKQKIIFEKQQAIQQERTRIAMEMHDDLGSGLTQIRYLADGLINNPPVIIKEKAFKIENSAKQLVDNMNDIIWTIKTDNNNLVDILGYIRKQTAETLENVGIDYNFDFPVNGAEIILANEQKRNLLLISKEAVHNIIKHSQASMVTITARQDERFLHLTISDNGKGIAGKSKVHVGNGLKNMKLRAGQINGNIEIIEDKGTLVHLTLKLA
jgi:signal transduction histidine kinase/ligand-binding sensor domain-containing protein